MIHDNVNSIELDGNNINLSNKIKVFKEKCFLYI